MIIRNIIIQIFILITILFSINSNDIDSDGDVYMDAEEIQARTDPKDRSSLIYQEYWPYNLNKDMID